MENILLLCLKIFFGRIFDVSIGTLRAILTIKEKHFLAAMFGFLEISIWFIIVQEALNSASGNLWIVLAYAGGFSAGTYLGGKFSSLLIKSYVEIRAVTSAEPELITKKLHESGFGVTSLRVNPSEFSDNHTMLIIQTRMKQEKAVRSIIHSVDPNAFIMLDETKVVYNGFFQK